MTPRGARAAAWWADCYTRGLAPEVRDGRRAEIASDVHEQLADGGRGGAVVWRTVRGLHADLAWRREERRLMQASRRPTRLLATWGVLTQNWFAPLAVLVAVFDLLVVVNAVAGGDSVEPGDVVLAFVLVGLATSVLGGLWLRERAALAGPAAPRRELRVGWLLALVAVLVVVAALMMVGVAGGTVGPFLVGVALLAATTVVLGTRLVVRAVRASDPRARGALADAMIIVGTLPALGFWWAVVPTVVALVVIFGVLTTNPRVRVAV